MYGPKGQEATTTADAYEQVWKPLGWRKSPKAAEKAPPPESSEQD